MRCASHEARANARRSGLWGLSTPSVASQQIKQDHPRLATSVCQLRHDQMEEGPTEPHTGCGTFLLCFVVRGGGRVLLSGLWYGAGRY